MAAPEPWVVAVIVSTAVSVCTVAGFALQACELRRAAREAKDGLKAKWPKMGELVLSPLWVVGALLQTVPNLVGDVVAYTLAPMSLTAPLSGVSVVMNTSLAPCMLGERLHRWPDLPATFVILVGTVLTTSMGAHKDVKIFAVDQLESIAMRPTALSVLAVILGSVAVCELLQAMYRTKIEKEAMESFENPRMSKVILPAWGAAGTACLTNLALKAFSELTKISGTACVISLAACVCPCAMLQIQGINRGLRLYPQTVFFPVYGSLLVLSNSLFGSLYYEEYAAMTGRNVAIFSLGICHVMFGICLYSQRKVIDERDAAGMQASLLQSEPCIVVDECKVTLAATPVKYQEHVFNDRAFFLFSVSSGSLERFGDPLAHHLLNYEL